MVLKCINISIWGFFERIFFVTQDVSLTGAALLIDALQANGLNNMYGVVGIPVTDFARLAELKGMKFYEFRREDAAVDAAAAAGFLTGKPGVALTVSAPGFLNGLTALAEATKNCFPMIMISGSSDHHIIDLDRGDYEGLDQYNVAKPLCKAAYRVERAVELLKNAKHPAIILGKGSAYARSEAEVRELVTRLVFHFCRCQWLKALYQMTHHHQLLQLIHLL